MRKLIILKIYGKVQRVFFRDTSQAEAKSLNLVGWVRNASDGTVEMAAEGEDKDLKKFIEWCKYGPDHAEVEKVDAQWLSPANQFTDFLIK